MVDKNAIAAQINAIIQIGLERSMMIVDAFESVFVNKVSEKLASMTMKELVKRKNPYLYRATGVETCDEYVQRAFSEYIAGMRGNFFGLFFESVAQILSGGTKPDGTGEIDLEVQKDGEMLLYVIKSGASGHNASSLKKALDDLSAVSGSFEARNIRAHKNIAYAYGRHGEHVDDGVRKMASKDFWAEMSGDADFYVKLLDVAAALSPMFQADMESPYERLLAEAHELFCEGDAIRWDKVIRLVSG